MIGQWNQAWEFGDCCCNFGELSGAIVSPTKMGYKYCEINIGHVLIASTILVNQVGVIMSPTNNGSQI